MNFDRLRAAKAAQGVHDGSVKCLLSFDRGPAALTQENCFRSPRVSSCRVPPMEPRATAVFESFDPLRRAWSYVFDRPQTVRLAWTLGEILPLLQEADDAAREGQWAALMLSYEAAPAFDSAMEVHSSHDFPLGWLAVFQAPSSQARYPDLVALPETHWRPQITREQYAAGIAAIRSAIARGDCYQVNYTFPFECTFRGDAWAWFRSLGASQGAGYSAWLDLGTCRILSFSPELFFEREGNTLRSRPMKGTAPRGRWAGEDDECRDKLQESAKDQAENVMIVDLLRNDLGRVSCPGSVHVSQLFDVERYPTVLQMTSTIESECQPGTKLVDLFRALFPCGSVTGAPKISAMNMIRNQEPFPRGVYTGSIGLVRPGGDCTFSVAIRTLVLDTTRRSAVFGVGGGITYDSTPENEYAECLTKARFLTEPRPEFRLIETLRLEAGAYFLHDRHVRRILESARFFGFMVDEAGVRAALENVRQRHNPGTWKVRLLASVNGLLENEAIPFVEQAGYVYRVALAPRPLDSSNRFLYHKTTHRAFYEQQLLERNDCDDLIFWNERGEVTEASVANIVVEIDGQKWTPARVSGLLAGTFREELLASGEIRERVISKEELRCADRILLINSVRRWMAVQWV